MNTLRRICFQATFLALLAVPTLAQTVGMEANGRVLSNTMTSGPLAGASAGDPVYMAFDVKTPGAAIATGYENYTISKTTFQLDAGGFQTGMTTSGVKIALQNDFPVSDGVHLITAKISANLWMEFELWGAHGAVFSSTDATQEAGTYDGSSFQATSWVMFGSGGTLEIEFLDFIIQPQATPGQLIPWNCGVNPAQSLVALSGLPVIGQSFILGIDNPLGTQAPGSLPILVFSDGLDAAGQCGSLLPNFAMAGGGAAGALLVDLLSPNPFATIYGPPWAGPGMPAPFPITVPYLPSFVGLSLYAQGVMIDPVTPGATFGATNGMEMVIGS